MTEQEWLASEDPAAMLRWVQQVDSPVAVGHGLPHPPMSVRKLRLFAAACYWDVAAEADACSCRGSAAAREAESWADGQPPVIEPGTRNMSLESFPTGAAHAASALQWSGYHRGNRTMEELAADQAAILRDIAGNPVRPVTLPPGPECQTCHGRGELGTVGGTVACYTCATDPDRRGSGRQRCPWLTPTVVSLAQAAYEERKRRWVGRKHDHDEASGWEESGHLDPVRLAILADALEEAGCDSVDLLQHLRGYQKCQVCLAAGPHDETACRCSPYLGGVCERGWVRDAGPHVRGCWPVDLILGKE